MRNNEIQDKTVEIFRHKIDVDSIRYMENTYKIAEDIVVRGPNEEENDDWINMEDYLISLLKGALQEILRTLLESINNETEKLTNPIKGGIECLNQETAL